MTRWFIADARVQLLTVFRIVTSVTCQRNEAYDQQVLPGCPGHGKVRTTSGGTMRIDGVLRAKGTEVISVSPHATLHDAATLLRKHRIGALLVIGADEQVAGILSERDIVAAVADRGAAALGATVDSAMSAEVVVCSPSDTVEQLMAIMTERRFRHLPVVSEGSLLGIVSIGDVVKRRLAEVSDEAQALHEYITHGR